MHTHYQESEFFFDNLPPENTPPLSFRDSDICGEGASCRVYQMRLSGIRVAVKRLKAEYRDNPLFLESYRKEYQLGLQLRHPSLPIYRGLHENKEDTYMVMEYIDGVTLFEFLDSEEGVRFFREEKNLKNFLWQILDVVTYLHRKGIVHCDLKPSNIMLRHSDRGVMLIDLDKAYSPIYDRSYGAGPTHERSHSKGNNPKINDDFTAIALLTEYIEGKSGKKRYGLKRFLAECHNSSASDESMAATLRNASTKSRKIWIASTIVATIILIFYLLTSGSYIGSRQPIASPLVGDSTDSISATKGGREVKNTIEEVSEGNRDVEIPTQENNSSSATSPAASSAIPSTPQSSELSKPERPKEFNFDNEMADFTKRLREMEKRLLSGRASINELNDMRTEAITLRAAKTNDIFPKYKECNPGKTEIEIYNSFMEITNGSSSQRFFDRFYSQLNDTISKRLSLH